MVKTSIEKIADPIGFDIGKSDNETQAALLNGLCRSLNQLGDDLDTQLCYISDHLTQGSKNVLKALVKFNNIKQ